MQVPTFWTWYPTETVGGSRIPKDMGQFGPHTVDGSEIQYINSPVEVGI